jgi:hypothetical protein
MEEKMVNENITADSVNSVDENNLADVAGGKGTGVAKLCTDASDSPIKLHRGVLIKKDNPANGMENNSKILVYQCNDCGKVLKLKFDLASEERYRARILETGDEACFFRGEWK